MQIEASGSVDLNDPPQGAWYQDASDGFVVGATTRNSIGFLVVPAMCLLSVFSLSICRGHSVHGNVEPPLMGIIFGLEALVLGSVAVMCICGKVEVRTAELKDVFSPVSVRSDGGGPLIGPA